MFDFADYHFVEVQSSVKKIHKGLDMWLASKIEATGDPNCEPPQWGSVRAMYTTIDEIQQGNAPFVTIHFKYSGPLPANPPAWMTQTYELCVRDVREVLRHQLETEEFADEFCTTPYRQFTPDGERVFTNLFSGDWVWKEAVCSVLSMFMGAHF